LPVNLTYVEMIGFDDGACAAVIDSDVIKPTTSCRLRASTYRYSASIALSV
jgi:hypothetical protein